VPPRKKKKRDSHRFIRCARGKGKNRKFLGKTEKKGMDDVSIYTEERVLLGKGRKRKYKGMGKRNGAILS